MTLDDIFSDMIPKTFEAEYSLNRYGFQSATDISGKFFVSRYELELPRRELFMEDKALLDFIPGFMSSITKYFSNEMVIIGELDDNTSEHRKSMQYREYSAKIEDKTSLMMTLDLSKMFVSLRIKSYDFEKLKHYDLIMQLFNEELIEYTKSRIKN